MKAFVRRWLGLEGPGGLANVLALRDGQIEALTRDVQAQRELLGKIVPVLNDHTQTLQRVGVYEQQVPGIRRVFLAMQARAIRERKRREAEQALAAPPAPETGPTLTPGGPVPPPSEVFPAVPPQDAVLDEVSSEVGGG